MKINSATGKQTRNAAATKERVIQAALVEFGSRGYGGGRIAEIANTASCNIRMVYHYFGSKEGLFLAVLEHAYSGIRTAEQSLNLARLTPRDAIEHVVDFTWDYYLENPEFLTLVNSANLHKARHLKKSKRLPEMHTGMLNMLDDVLRRGAANGEFRTDANALQLAISIAALGYYYLTNRYTMAVIFKFDPMTPDALAERRAEAKRTILASLRPD